MTSLGTLLSSKERSRVLRSGAPGLSGPSIFAHFNGTQAPPPPKNPSGPVFKGRWSKKLRTKKRRDPFPFAAAEARPPRRGGWGSRAPRPRRPPEEAACPASGAAPGAAPDAASASPRASPPPPPSSPPPPRRPPRPRGGSRRPSPR